MTPNFFAINPIFSISFFQSIFFVELSFFLSVYDELVAAVFLRVVERVVRLLQQMLDKFFLRPLP